MPLWPKIGNPITFVHNFGLDLLPEIKHADAAQLSDPDLNSTNYHKRMKVYSTPSGRSPFVPFRYNVSYPIDKA